MYQLQRFEVTANSQFYVFWLSAVDCKKSFQRLLAICSRLQIAILTYFGHSEIFLDKKTLMFFVFMLKTLILGTR